MKAEQENFGVIHRYYDTYLERYGQDFGSLNWGSRYGQNVRFEALSQIADLDSTSVLDVGCGHGDLLDFLKQKWENIQYAGIDLHEQMIAIAQQKYSPGDFSTKRLDEFDAESFDYVLSSGIFPLRLPDNLAHINNTLQQMYAVCRKGVGTNFLSGHVPAEEREADEFYAEPEDIISIVRTIADRYILRHDYKGNDFTVYLYK